MSGHLPGPPPCTPLVLSPVTRATAPPSSGPQSVPPATSGPETGLAARVRPADRLPLAPPVPDSLLGDNSSTLGPEGEAWLDGLVGRLPGTTRQTTLSVLLVSLVDLLGSWSTDLVTWSEGHPVVDPASLTEVVNGCIQPVVNSRLWRLLQLHQSRQDGHLRRPDSGSNWQQGGAGQGERRDEPAAAGGSWPRGAPASPYRGTSGGGGHGGGQGGGHGGGQSGGAGYWDGGYWHASSGDRAGAPADDTRGYTRTYGGQESPSGGYEGPATNRRRTG